MLLSKNSIRKGIAGTEAGQAARPLPSYPGREEEGRQLWAAEQRVTWLVRGRALPKGCQIRQKTSPDFWTPRSS